MVCILSLYGIKEMIAQKIEVSNIMLDEKFVIGTLNNGSTPISCRFEYDILNFQAKMSSEDDLPLNGIISLICATCL